MPGDPWSILAGPTSYGLIECEITRYSYLVNGPGISPQTRWRRNQRDWSCLCCWAGPAFWHETSSGTSNKPQATSLTAGPGDDRMDLERNNYGHNTIKKNSRRPRRDPEVSKTGYGEV